MEYYIDINETEFKELFNFLDQEGWSFLCDVFAENFAKKVIGRTNIGFLWPEAAEEAIEKLDDKELKNKLQAFIENYRRNPPMGLQQLIAEGLRSQRCCLDD